MQDSVIERDPRVSLHVITTPEADAQIRIIGEWWWNNRPGAPDLFTEELANCFMLLEQTPKIGKPYRRHPCHGVGCGWPRRGGATVPAPAGPTGIVAYALPRN